MHISDCCQFSDIHISQGSVATHLGCGGVFLYDFVTNFLLSLTVKEFRKLVNIWWSYGQKFGVLFFYETQCIYIYTYIYIYIYISGICFQRTQSAELPGQLTDVVKPQQLSVHTSGVETRGVWTNDGLEFLPDRHQLHWVMAIGHRQPYDSRPHDIQRFARLVDDLDVWSGRQWLLFALWCIYAKCTEKWLLAILIYRPGAKTQKM